MEMWNKPPQLDIILLCLMMTGGGSALPTELPRYSQLGLGPLSVASISNMTTNNCPGRLTTAATPDFEYSLLGQDPNDQHWYRVGLTPKANKTAFRAQFATRTHPPFDEKLAHRHDKTILDLLNWLDRSEDQSLWKLYRDLLEYRPAPGRNGNALEVGNQVPRRACHGRDHLTLVGDEGTTTSTVPPPAEGNLKKEENFVYFVKGLGPSTEPV